MARLVLNCDGVGLGTHELTRGIVMIGRAPLNHIVIDHPTVSAQHAGRPGMGRPGRLGMGMPGRPGMGMRGGGNRHDHFRHNDVIFIGSFGFPWWWGWGWGPWWGYPYGYGYGNPYGYGYGYGGGVVEVATQTRTRRLLPWLH